MGITQTPRLHLQKQAQGDTGWHTGLNGGFDLADARLHLISSDFSGAADPNGVAPGYWVGLRYTYEGANPPIQWICTTAGDAVTAVWRRISAAGIAASAPVGGNTLVEDILVDHEARLSAREAYVPPYPRSYLAGLQMTWNPDADNQQEVSVSPGVCRDLGNTLNLDLAAALKKHVGSGWTAGEGGGMAAGLSVTDGHWYHVFALGQAAGGCEIGFDEDVTGSVLLGTAAVIADGWTVARRIGSVRATGTNLLNFIQRNDFFLWAPSLPPLESGSGNYTASPGTDLTLTYLPPDVDVEAFFALYMSGLVTGSAAMVESGAIDIGPVNFSAQDIAQIAITSGAGDTHTEYARRLAIDQVIRLRVGADSSANYYTQCRGWIDYRGKGD